MYILCRIYLSLFDYISSTGNTSQNNEIILLIALYWWFTHCVYNIANYNRKYSPHATDTH